MSTTTAAKTFSGPTAVELSDNLSSIHNAPNYGRGSYGGLTTTDTSAPLGGTYSLLSNTGENAEAPITYDFMYHMPNLWNSENYISADYGAPTALPDRTGARFVEFANEQKHNVAHANAQDLFRKKKFDDTVARQGDYVYGTAYALDSSSPNMGVDPSPALYDEILDIDGNKTRVAGSSYHPEKGYDYAYNAKDNYAGYDPLAWTTKNEDGVTEYSNTAIMAHPDAPLREIATNQILPSKVGDYFNTGHNLKKFSAIPTSEFGKNPAIHPAYQRDGKEVQYTTNSLGETYNANAYQDSLDADKLFQEQQQPLFNQGQSPNSLLMPPSGMDSTGGGSGFGLGYSSGTGTGNYSRGYQQDILGLLDNLIGR
tara:strand:+ start:497 stop:1603 length:1107 start_codon:yes stop_codon:yes gene_type:complete